MSEDERGTVPEEDAKGDTAPASGRFSRLEEDRRRREDRSKKLIRGAGLAAVVALCVGAAVVLIGMPGADTDPSLQSADAEDPSQPAPGPQSQSEGDVNCDQFANAAPPPDHPCALRDAFQDLYQTFSAERYPPLKAVANVDFVGLALKDIEAAEEDAIAAFERSNFAFAVTSIREALAQADRLDTEIEQAFQRFFQNARGAFENGDPVSATNWIEQALALNSEDTTAQELAHRIEVLPQVLELLSEADAAAVQNDLKGAIDGLRAVLNLDPARSDVAERFQDLSRQYAEQRYSAFLRQASSAIAARDMAAARSATNSARRLFPARQDADALLAQIEQIERQQRIDKAAALARQRASEDRWTEALSAYERVLAEDETHVAALEGRDQAKAILSAQSRLSSLLGRPERFGDGGIRGRVISYLQDIDPLAGDSRTLQNQILETQAQLKVWQTKVAVTVVSDGKSLVIVRRVGRVGVVERKDIQLAPGTYDFECSRKGYRSKIVKHFVPPAQDGSVVTIACDVPI